MEQVYINLKLEGRYINKLFSINKSTYSYYCNSKLRVCDINLKINLSINGCDKVINNIEEYHYFNSCDTDITFEVWFDISTIRKYKYEEIKNISITKIQYYNSHKLYDKVLLLDVN